MLKKILFISTLILAVNSTAFSQVDNSVGDNTQVDSDLKFGLELYKNKMYDLAEEQLNKFLQQYPTSPSASQARYYLAMSEYNQNKFGSAAVEFQDFAMQFPNDPQAPTAWSNAANCYAKNNDYAAAALSCERLQVFYPKDSRAPASLLDAAKYFQLSGDTSRAQMSLLTVEQDYPTSTGYYTATLQLGNLYFSSGQEVKAEDQFKSLLSSDNDSVRVMGLLALGRLSRIRGMSVQAAKYLEDAIKLNIAPQSIDASLERIQLDLDAGNFTSAFQRADQLKLDGLNDQEKDKVTFEKTFAAIAAGDNETLKSLFNEAHALSPEYRLGLARLLKDKKRYEEGLSILRSFPAKNSNDVALNLHAEMAFRAGRMKLADSLLALSIERTKNPGVTEVVRLLGIESKYLKDIDLARRTFYQYQNILKNRPDVSLYYTACFAEYDGNYAEAMRSYDDLVASYPESDFATASDSASHYISTFKNTDYKDAVAGLADIVSEAAISPDRSTLLQLGTLFENNLKDYRKAERIFRQLVAISKGDTQRVAKYLLADMLEKVSTEKADKNSEWYSIFEQLSLSVENDSITENSSVKVIEAQLESGDSVNAGNSALTFLRRFPSSAHVPEVNSMLADAMYSESNYHEAIVQAELVQADPLEAGSAATAQLVIVRSEIAIDSLDEAKETLETFLNSRPPKKYLLNGQLLYIGLLKRMNLDAGAAYAKILQEIQPSIYKERIKLALGDYLYSTAKFDTAYSVYQTIGDDELWPAHLSNVVYKMAYCKLRLGDLDGAKNLFAEVVTSSTDQFEISDSYNQLGKIYGLLGDKRMSASFLEKGGDLDALVSAADTYFRIGDYENASQLYKKIQSEAGSDSLRPFVAARLIEIDYKTDEIKSADAAAAKFKKNFPGNEDEYLAQFLVDKAEYLIRTKEPKDAQKLLDDVKSDYDNTAAYPTSLLDGAQIMVEAGELDKAQEKLSTVLKNFPNSAAAPLARFELGNIYYAQEKYQDAINVFRDIYGDSTTDGTLLHNVMGRLISAYESAGQYDGALDVARKFIARYPDDESIMDVKIKVGILYEELKYFDQALLTFQSLAKEANRDYQAELHYYVGAIYDDKSDYSNAILEFLKVPYLVSKNAVVDWAAQSYYMAGKCYEQLNKPNDAIAMYQKIVDKPHTDKNFVDGAEREINRVKALLK